MSKKTESTCIYCKQTKVLSREHILQRGLGGDLVQAIACEACNNGFSNIDQSLAERSIIALHRVGFAKIDGMETKLGGDHFTQDPRTGAWLAVEIRNAMSVRIFPQLHLLSQDGNEVRINFTGSEDADLENLIQLVDKRVAAGDLPSTYRKTSGERCTHPHLVMHRDNDLYVRACTDNQAVDFLKMLNGNWSGVKQMLRDTKVQSGQQGSDIHSHTTVCLDDNYRAIAKSALNFVAVKRTSEFVLRAEFDAVREYIRGNDIRHDGKFDPEQIVHDRRFVTDATPDLQAIVPTSKHAFLLFYHPPSLFCLITLYGRYSFVVRLADIELDNHLLDTHEFSVDRTGNSEVSISELAKRLWHSSE